MLSLPKILRAIILVTLILLASGCKKIRDLRDANPDIQPLKEGFKTSAAIGYCASLAVTALEGGQLPENVKFEAKTSSGYSNAGILYVETNDLYPLPFNDHVGNMIISGIWGDNGRGVINIIFSDFDILAKRARFYGIHTVPIFREQGTGNIITVFARQDIVLGEGNDTLINLSLSNPQFNLETDRLDDEQPNDVYIAVSQNVWFVTINQQNTDYIYDDAYLVNGGGQIAEASSTEGGIQYHAMINTVFNYSECTLNPIRGDAFIQNLKAGDGINLGNILISFHDHCDGKAYVDVATGDYLKYFGKQVNLNFDTFGSTPTPSSGPRTPFD